MIVYVINHFLHSSLHHHRIHEEDCDQSMELRTFFKKWVAEYALAVIIVLTFVIDTQ